MTLTPTRWYLPPKNHRSPMARIIHTPKEPTVAKKPKKESGTPTPSKSNDSLAEKLKKPFSLTDCKRVVALCEEWATLIQKKAMAASQTKALQAKYDEGGDTHTLEKIALKMVRNAETKSKCTADIKATMSDLNRIVLEELADGATVWAAAENAGKAEASEEQEPDDQQLKLAQ